MSDYFEERKRESQEKDLEEYKLTPKRKQELKKLAARFVSRNDVQKALKGTVKQKKTARKELHKLFKKPKPKLTVAQKAARSAKRKRTVKKVFKAVRTFIYGKPKTNRKTTTKRKSTKKK